MTIKLESPAFDHGATIPKEHTCDGADRSPALTWSGLPTAAKSLLLVCTDPDAPRGVFHHWAIFDIPAAATGLDAGYGPESSADGLRQAVNDFGKPGYGGPCPPRGDKPHAYHFRLSALDAELTSAGPGAKIPEIIALARPHEIAFVELVGYYGRS
jgi:Raf kinase inhibitor-like YbhB/YbcL family protein